MADNCVCGLPASDHLTDDELLQCIGVSFAIVDTLAGKNLTWAQIEACYIPRNPTGCPQNVVRGLIFRRLNRAGISFNGRQLA